MNMLIRLGIIAMLGLWSNLLFAESGRWLVWDHSGEEVAYRLDGKAGRAVVQIHGIGAGASSAQTSYQIESLVTSGYRAYSLDLIGWGRSIGPQRRFTGADYVELIAAFLDEVVGEPAALIGHSLGGTYAIAVAAAHPERVTTLVLNAPVGAESFTAEPTEQNVLLWERLVSGPVGRTAYTALGSWPSLASFCRNSLYVDPAFCTPSTILDYRRFTRQADSIYGAASFLTGNLGLDVRDGFAAMTQPVLLIWGDQNAFTTLSEAETFIGLNPDAVLEVISPGGALVNDEQRERFDTLLIEHLSLHHAP